MPEQSNNTQTGEISTDAKRRYDETMEKWAKILKEDPSEENFAQAYAETQKLLFKAGDPKLNRAPDGTIYGYTGAEDDWEKQRIMMLIGEGSKKVLELGCGDGRLAAALVRRGAEVRAIDVSPYAIETARKLHEPLLAGGAKLTFDTGNAWDLDDADNSYDYALSADMVEHLHPTQLEPHLQECFRILKPGGAYIFSVPANVPEEEVDILHFGNYKSGEVHELLRKIGFNPRSAPIELFERTGSLETVFGKPRTLKSKIGHLLSRAPVIGPPIGRNLVGRWFGDINFFYAEKPG
jgi:2-polyprenyl-3-methyl-5-hydroxy-6-metoxy-1,4-benzoquinol methylase